MSKTNEKEEKEKEEKEKEKEKKDKEEKEKKEKEEKEKKEKEAAERQYRIKKEKWKELTKVIEFLESKGLKIKECLFFDEQAVFVNGKDLEEKIKGNLIEVCNQINKIMNSKISAKDPDKAIQEIYKQFKSVELITKVQREEGDNKKNIKKLVHYEQLVLLNKCNCGKEHKENEKYDHPEYLDVEKLFEFEPSFYYILNINRCEEKIKFFIYIIIFFIILFALNPIWPRLMKKVVWIISFGILIIALTTYIIKILVFIICFPFWYDVILFPDLDKPNYTLFESLGRIIQVKKSNNNKWYFKVIRFSLSIIFGIISFLIYKNPGIINDFKKEIINEFYKIYVFGEKEFVNKK